MSLIHRVVTNATARILTLRVPGINPSNPVVFSPSQKIDLLTKVSEDELEAMEAVLNALVASGTLTSQATIDTDNLHRGGEGEILAFGSAETSGGNASEAMTVTGLLATDTILTVQQRIQQNAVSVTGWNTQIDDGVTVTWTADPGSGATITVAVKR